MLAERPAEEIGERITGPSAQEDHPDGCFAVGQGQAPNRHVGAGMGPQENYMGEQKARVQQGAGRQGGVGRPVRLPGLAMAHETFE